MWKEYTSELIKYEYESCNQKCDRVIPSSIASYSWRSTSRAAAPQALLTTSFSTPAPKERNSCGYENQQTTLRKQRLECKLLRVIKPSLQLGGTLMLTRRELPSSAEQLF